MQSLLGWLRSRGRGAGLRFGVSLLLGLFVSALSFMVEAPTPAFATHFRAAQLTWTHASTAHQADFTLTMSFRRSYFAQIPPYSSSSLPNVGSTIQFVPGTMGFGDGATLVPNLTVNSIDATNDTLTAEGTFSHIYAGNGPYTAYIDGCCRLSSSINNHDGNLRAETIVSFPTVAGSPESSISPVVDCPRNSPCDFHVPAVDPSGLPLHYRFSTAAEAGDGTFSQPLGAAIDPISGLYTWNTTGQQLAPSGDTYYSTQVTIESISNGTAVAKVAVDFFLRITSTTNNPPVFNGPTPTDGATLSGVVGTAVTFNVAAADPDAGDTVTLGIVNLPAGATFTPTAGDPATAAFSWTPGATGSVVLNLTAQDQFGLGALQRSITIAVAKQPATLTLDAASLAQTYDGNPKAVTVTTSPPGLSAVTIAYAQGGSPVAAPTAAGSYAVTATLDNASYQAAPATGTLVIQKATPSITWANPADIGYGTALGATQLDATTTVPGGFAYTPATGTVLSAGNGQTLQVAFTPTDSANYTTANASATINVQKATPTVTWANPADIVYGTALSNTQLDATASVPGSFTYTPADGAVLHGGSGQTLSVAFAPTDGTNYSGVLATAVIDVTKADQTITFGGLAGKTFGDAPFTLSANATSGLTVSFTASGACSVSGNSVSLTGAGTCTITAAQSGNGDFNAAAPVAQSFTIAKATPAITWANPADVVYGTALSATQLDATASTAGSFSYAPPAGTVLTVGSQTLKVTFTPNDTADYITASTTVTINVQKATPTITWATPTDIVVGTALSGTQLNASAHDASANTVPGSFTYTPPAGTVLTAGGHTLHATFTPTDGADYNGATATVTINVHYAFGGFLPPLTAPGHSNHGFKAGQTIPVKFDLTDANGKAVTNAVATLSVNGQPAPNPTFTVNGNHYQDNLDTTGLPNGNLTLVASLDDGTTQSIVVTLTAK